MIGAIDIGGTKVAVGAVTRDGAVHVARECPTLSERGFEDGFSRMADLLRAVEQEAGATLEGIGIGSTGPIDPRLGVIGDAALVRGWAGAPIVDRLSAEFGVPAAMENDADAVALAEAAWGAGRGAQCLVYVTVGTGIGVAMVRNGELYRGADGGHPELGHMAVDVSAGPRCYCGLDGCWESLAAGPAIENWYNGRISGARISAKEICQRAMDGEALARQAIARASYYLGLGLVNVVTAFCPDVVLLGGGVLRSASLFLDNARSLVSELATQVPTANLKIEAVEQSEWAGLRGAAAAWLHRYERIETNPKL